MANPGRNIGLRGAGALLLAIGSLVMRHLFAGVPARSGIDMALAAIGFLSLSTGTALLALGTHLLDPIEISERWRTK